MASEGEGSRLKATSGVAHPLRGGDGRPMPPPSRPATLPLFGRARATPPIPAASLPPANSLAEKAADAPMPSVPAAEPLPPREAARPASPPPPAAVAAPPAGGQNGGFGGGAATSPSRRAGDHGLAKRARARATQGARSAPRRLPAIAICSIGRGAGDGPLCRAECWLSGSGGGRPAAWSRLGTASRSAWAPTPARRRPRPSRARPRSAPLPSPLHPWLRRSLPRPRHGSACAKAPCRPSSGCVRGPGADTA